MKKSNLLIALSITFSLSVFQSCNDANVPTQDLSFFSATLDEALAPTVSETAASYAETSVNTYLVNLSQSLDGKQKSLGFGPRITLASEINEYPRVYVIDYGTEGYYIRENVVFKGKIRYTISNISSSEREFVFEDFYVNNDEVKGNRIVKVIETNVLEITSNDTILTSLGKTITRISVRTRTKIDDDSYSININTVGVNSKGVSYEVATEKPLVSVPNWKYFVSGVIVITTEKGVQHLDFGNNEVDDVATSTINNVSQSIVLKWKLYLIYTHYKSNNLNATSNLRY